MYINQINIESFGAIRNQSFTFSEGFNIILGKNESGKSTLCAFIKYVFYGFNDSREKERLSSLDTMISSGSLRLFHNDTFYTVVRRDAEKGRSKVNVLYDDGSEFHEWKEQAQSPGEYFLSIPESLYSRSVYVSQALGAAQDGASGEAISNLLLSGDEAINLKNAQNKLENLRKELKLKKGRGGLITNSEDKLEGLKDKYRLQLENKRASESLEAKIKETKSEITRISEKIKTAEHTARICKAKKIRTYLDRQKAANDSIKELQEQSDALTQKYTSNGFCPNESYYTELISEQKELSQINEACLNLKNRLLETENERNARIPKSYSAFLTLGRSEGITSAYGSCIKRKKLCLSLSVILAAVSIISFILIAVNTLFAIAGAISALATAAATALLTVQIKKKNSIETTLSPDRSSSPQEICRICEEYENTRHQEAHAISAEYNAKYEEYLRKKEHLSELAYKWDKDSIENAVDAYTELSKERTEISQKITSLSSELSVTNALLFAYSENEKQSALAYSAQELDTDADEDKLSAELTDLRSQLIIHEASLRRYELENAATGASNCDTFKTLSDINTENQIHSHLTLIYDAILLAQDTLNEAEGSIRRTVSPYLSSNASEIFGRITSGSYNELKVDPSMNMKYVKENGSAPTESTYLSRGSSDLAWLCLRFALHKKLSEKNTLPLILDESLVYFDDQRLLSILNELKELGNNGNQILLFSASQREISILNDTVNTVTL